MKINKLCEALKQTTYNTHHLKHLKKQTTSSQEGFHVNIPALDRIAADTVAAVSDGDFCVAELTPTGSPRIADDPVGKVKVRIKAMANDHDGVVQFTALEAIWIVDDTGLIVFPVVAVSCNKNDDRAFLKGSQVGGRRS